MHDSISAAPARGLAVSAAAALGPIALGAVIGAKLGPWIALREAVIVPAIVVGLTAATVPALYIATAATGSKLTAPDLARAVVRGLEALGVVLLGIAGPLAFVLATTRSRELGVQLGALALGSATLLGIHRMRIAIKQDAGLAPSAIDGGLFLVWAGVALTLGTSLYFNLMSH